MVSLSEVRKVSMMDLEALERLQMLAREGEDGIVEIGSYIGGSTIALASGHMGRRKHAVIEIGGSYPDQPFLPTDNIFRDWRANVSAFGVADHVKLFEGWSTDSRLSQRVTTYVGSIGLFFFDGDGHCAEQFAVYARYMRPGCAIALDDYHCSAGGKDELVRPWIEDMLKRGALLDGEVLGSTWFGRLGNIRGVNFNSYRHDTGFAYYMPAPDPALGAIELFEDGFPLPHATQMHSEVREVGHGAYSHWMFADGPRILFSTSDNSNPNTNGRHYEIIPQAVRLAG